MIEVQNLLTQSLQRMEDESINREQRLTGQYNELHQRLQVLSMQQQQSQSDLVQLNRQLERFSNVLSEFCEQLEEKLMDHE